MDDLISRAATIAQIKENYCHWCDHIDLCKSCETQDCIAAIEQQVPAVDAVTVVHGRWVEKRWMTECDWCVINHRALICTACSIEIADGEKTPYCPYCGAKNMED